MTTGQDLTGIYAKLDRILGALASGEINYNGALALVQELFDATGVATDPLEAAKSYLSSAGFNSQADVGRLVQETGPVPRVPTPLETTQGKLPGTAGQDIATGRTLEEATDPFTAYLSRLGVGGKTAFNPAERYQVGLFDPLKNLYDIEQRLSSKGGPLQDPTRLRGTFADYLNNLGGGLAGLTSGAGAQLKRIFGATPTQKETLGFEPGQPLIGSAGEAAGVLDPGQLEELQELFKYGLRGTQGVLGARYAAQRLPQAQQAYYSQRAAGGGGVSNFVDWLKANWGVQF